MHPLGDARQIQVDDSRIRPIHVEDRNTGLPLGPPRFREACNEVLQRKGQCHVLYRGADSAIRCNRYIPRLESVAKVER